MLATIKKCFKWLFFVGLLYVFLLYNLESNATYYYKHSALTNKNGTPFVLLNHLWWYHDDKIYQDGDYIYQLKGVARISFLNRESQEDYSFHESNGLYDHFTLMIGNKESGETNYYFDDRFKLIEIFDHDFNSLPITKEEEQRARKAIEETTKQLMKEVEPPLINLQWLYDWTYYLRNGK